MKLRLLKLTPEQLIRALQGKPSELNLPSDLELLDVKYDAFTRQVSAVVRSDSFEDVAESMPIPEFTINAPSHQYRYQLQQQSPNSLLSHQSKSHRRRV